MNNSDKTALLKQRKQELERIEQSENGKKNARERLKLLFDEGSFMEIGAFVSSGVAAEGVVAGYGTVDGRLVYAYSQDVTAMGAALGTANTKKISDIIDMAVKMGAPVVNILDSKGARISEGVNALSGIGGLLSKSAEISGVVPQISIVLGSCAGSAVFIAQLSDFVIMSETNSEIFMTGPSVTTGITGKQVDAQTLGGAAVCAQNGIADFTYNTEEDCFNAAKKLLNYLPSNNLESTPAYMSNDDINRAANGISAVIPEGDAPYNIKDIINEIIDNSDFFEASAEYAQNIVTGFAYLNGSVIGIIANQPIQSDGVLNIAACKKASKFIRICDSFNIPIVTFVDVPGFATGIEEELGGISKYGAALLYAYAEATVPKVSLVVRRAYGSAYLSMGAKSIGADIVFAYPTAKISIMSPESAANIIYNDEIAASQNPINERKAKINEYEENEASPYTAAKNGFIDDIILPEDTRPLIISALDMLASKREDKIAKKHGNMPV